MTEFEIKIDHDGETHQLPAKLLIVGFTHKIAVDVFGVEVLFEPDEERNYRAVVTEEQLRKQPNVQLLKLIAEQIELMVK